MFSSEIYRNFQTARRQKTLPATAGLRTRATFGLLDRRSTTELHGQDGLKTGNYEL